MPRLEIRLLEPTESHEVYCRLAELHAGEITGGFLTSLGLSLLTRLYQAIGRSPDAFMLVAVQEGTLTGFLCASLDTRRVFRHVLSRSWPRLLPVLLRHVFRWSTVRRCWETLRYPSRQPTPDLPAAEILNFCVTQQRQRSGVGRQLFTAMEAQYRLRGIRLIRIVTGASQLSAIGFYEKLGAKLVTNIEIHDRVKSRIFTYEIQDCQPAKAPKA